jgi:hypothetical protein
MKAVKEKIHYKLFVLDKWVQRNECIIEFTQRPFLCIPKKVAVNKKGAN